MLFRSGGFPFAPDDTPQDRRFGGVATGGARVPPEKARELHLRLKALMQEIQDAPRDPDGVPVELLLAWYTPPAAEIKGAAE